MVSAIGCGAAALSAYVINLNDPDALYIPLVSEKTIHTTTQPTQFPQFWNEE